MATFRGELEQLQALVSAAGYDGEWSEIEHGHQFRSVDKSILNWYPKNGTISYGGPKDAKAKFQEKMAAVLSDRADAIWHP